MSRTLLIVIATPVVLIIAAILLLPLVLDKETLLAMAADALKEKTGAILVVDGDVELSVFPNVSVEVSDAAVTMPGEQEMAVKVRSLGVGLQLMPLFSGKAEIGDIAINGMKLSIQSAPKPPALDTSTLTDTQLDEFYKKRRRELEQAGQVSGAEAVIAVPLALNVEKLSVTDSVLEIFSADTKEATIVEIVQLNANGLNLDGKPIVLALDMRVKSGEGADPIDIKVEGRVAIDGATQMLNLNGMAIEVNGALADPVAVKANGAMDLSRQALDLQLELTLAKGDIRGEGQLRYASFETPQIDARLHFNKFDPALLALAGPEAVTASDSPSTESTASGDQPLPLNAIRAIDTRAALTIDEVNLAGHVVSKVKIKLRAVDGVVKLFPFTGIVHGGQLKVNSTLNAKHNPAKLFSKGELAGLSIATALSAMGSEPVATGEADLNWRLNSQGATTNQLVKALNGPINLLTRQLELKSINLEKMLCETVALANQESLVNSLPDVTRFSNLSVALKMNKGKLHLSPLRAELAHMKLTGKGELDVLKQDFAVTFAARLSPSLGELDPACRVNKRLTAIKWPVKCKGNVSGDPAGWCAVDSESILQDLAKKEVGHQLEKQASKLFDKFLKK